jgi:hypothetical protein
LQGAQDAPLFNMFLPLPRAIAQENIGMHQGLVHDSFLLSFIIVRAARI